MNLVTAFPSEVEKYHMYITWTRLPVHMQGAVACLPVFVEQVFKASSCPGILSPRGCGLDNASLFWKLLRVLTPSLLLPFLCGTMWAPYC